MDNKLRQRLTRALAVVDEHGVKGPRHAILNGDRATELEPVRTT